MVQTQRAVEPFVIRRFPAASNTHSGIRRGRAVRPIRTPLYPSFPKSCLQAFYQSRWWDGLNRIERPSSYSVARWNERNSQFHIEGFTPLFFRRELGGRGPTSEMEHWIGRKPDGKEYVLGLCALIKEAEARSSYIQKLCYWGRKPTGQEDSATIAHTIKSDGSQDIFEVRRVVSLESPVGNNSEGPTSLGAQLGIYDDRKYSRGRGPSTSVGHHHEIPSYSDLSAAADEIIYGLRKTWGIKQKRSHWRDESSGVQRDPYLRGEKRGGVNRKR